MKKREAELKSKVMAELKRQYPTLFYTFQIATAGWPDRGIVGIGRTTFWEFKHATPDFDSPGNQELMCQRLAIHGYHCRYVIWQEGLRGSTYQKTLIVHPRSVAQRYEWRMLAEDSCKGFNAAWVVDHIRKAHEL